MNKLKNCPRHVDTIDVILFHLVWNALTVVVNLEILKILVRFQPFFVFKDPIIH